MYYTKDVRYTEWNHELIVTSKANDKSSFRHHMAKC